jgi:DNA helicase-2/ATP-dependent DNA helicase PcrA
MDLNPAQSDAVSTLRGPLLVLAGAGTGKTRVVTYRIANLIRHGTSPGRILAVTFTRKAAGEMQERAAQLLGRRISERPFISTFHGLCVQILRRHIVRLGYPAEFTIFDRSDQESLARQVLREIKLDQAALRPSELVGMIGRWKSASIGPADAVALADTDKAHLAATAYRRYQSALKTKGAVDFDDLLLCTQDLFQQFDEVRAAEAGRFDHILVDEYQDTNAAQYRIVMALGRRHRNVCVVGDDDQSIYGWRGAEVTHILGFQRDWPDAKIVRLEANYRSTAPILEMANRLIACNAHRHAKSLRSSRGDGKRPRILSFKNELEEAHFAAADIRSLVASGEARPGDFAILFRTNEQTRSYETELRQVGIPYVVIGGMSFFDRKEVRDLLAYLKVVARPHDEAALLRIINTPPRGIGPAMVKSLLQQAVESGQPLWNVLADRAARPSGAENAAAAAFCKLIRDCQERFRPKQLTPAFRYLIEQVGYLQEIERQYPEANDRQTRWNGVQELVNSLGEYESHAAEPSLLGYLDQVTLDSREELQDKEAKLQADRVVLMTLHSAKGLEFPQVYMVGMEEGLLPHHRSIAMGEAAIDEERRLCYVGITRAQDRLTLTRALARRKWGKERDTIPSRFLFEMTGRSDHPAAMAARQGRLLPARAAPPPGPRRPAQRRARRR